MTLKELFDRALTNSGQFQYAQDRIELNVDAFKTLVMTCLGQYNSYVPWTANLFRSIQASRQWTFTIDNSPEVKGAIPKNIVSVTPVRIAGVVPYYFRDLGGPTSTVQAKEEYPFVYRKPTITVPVSADYDLLCTFDHELKKVAPEDNSDQYEITTITDNDPVFIDLVTAKFLIGLGRSRRAFTMSDIPLLTDASDLVSEGKDMLAQAEEDMAEKQGKWYLAWGG